MRARGLSKLIILKLKDLKKCITYPEPQGQIMNQITSDYITSRSGIQGKNSKCSVKEYKSLQESKGHFCTVTKNDIKLGWD